MTNQPPNSLIVSGPPSKSDSDSDAGVVPNTTGMHVLIVFQGQDGSPMHGLAQRLARGIQISGGKVTIRHFARLDMGENDPMATQAESSTSTLSFHFDLEEWSKQDAVVFGIELVDDRISLHYRALLNDLAQDLGKSLGKVGTIFALQRGAGCGGDRVQSVMSKAVVDLIRAGFTVHPFSIHHCRTPFGTCVNEPSGGDLRLPPWALEAVEGQGVELSKFLWHQLSSSDLDDITRKVDMIERRLNDEMPRVCDNPSRGPNKKHLKKHVECMLSAPDFNVPTKFDPEGAEEHDMALLRRLRQLSEGIENELTQEGLGSGSDSELEELLDRARRVGIKERQKQKKRHDKWVRANQKKARTRRERSDYKSMSDDDGDLDGSFMDKKSFDGSNLAALVLDHSDGVFNGVDSSQGVDGDHSQIDIEKLCRRYQKARHCAIDYERRRLKWLLGKKLQNDYESGRELPPKQHLESSTNAGKGKKGRKSSDGDSDDDNSGSDSGSDTIDLDDSTIRELVNMASKSIKDQGGKKKKDKKKDKKHKKKNKD